MTTVPNSHLEGASGGWVTGAREVASPNCDARPDGVGFDLIVIHGISLPPGQFGGGFVEQLFTNTLNIDAHPSFSSLEGLHVSSHFLIGRGGELVQFVPVSKRAWHAGVSSFEGRERCNDFSIGIELEGTDELPYEDAQYATLATLLDALTELQPAITSQRVVGHSDVAPGRKTDPGEAFDWPRLRASVFA
jgi:N-acetyl-anhydromuramoyl-L-alanine amidase